MTTALLIIAGVVFVIGLAAYASLVADARANRAAAVAGAVRAITERMAEEEKTL